MSRMHRSAAAAFALPAVHAAVARVAAVALVVAVPVAATSPAHAQSQSQSQAAVAANGASAQPLLTKPLAGIQGKEGLMLTVDIPPGADSPPHRHNANTFVYVLEGSVVMQVEGQPAVTLTKGQTFYESPSDVHTVSRNPSQTEPARILVFMVKDQGAPATVPAK